jgi:signal transduction histidine kinase
VVSDCALLFEPLAFEAGKPLDYQVESGVFVTGDGEKLHQVVSVLLDNAIKYGRPGGTIRLRLETTDRHARLQVTNENAGGPIPPQQLSRLFERFYRADASRGEESGFGLGLPIAASIAAEHKGTLRAESDEQSTRFTLLLPLRRPERGALPPAA